MAIDGQDYLHQSLGQAKKPHGCIVTIFGASGDLTKRKLIPALYNLALEKKLAGALRRGRLRAQRNDP